MGLLVMESGIVVGPFSLESESQRFTRLFLDATLRLRPVVPKLSTVRSVSLGRGRSETMVGLTTYRPSTGLPGSAPSQSLSFYSQLIDGLSDPAASAVIAHELAHAWLNEHESPEESVEREHEADALARRWGFGPELEALDAEAETVGR
ncbi:MAG TPA: hypothetical protein VJR06_07650 [Nitrososphaerales archaeon]|nr:hypothetical protein [Nitrososphaerales archaeon]